MIDASQIGLERRSVARGAVRLDYSAAGTGHAIVLVPSLGRGAEDFDAIVPIIAQAGFRVLTPEPRGIGGSSPLGDDDTLHEMAADVAAMIEQEGGAPVIAVGHAAGNWVVRVLAHDRPDLVRGVVLMAAIVLASTDAEMQRSITASLDTALPDEERVFHLRRAYFAPGNDPTPWLSGWHTEVAHAQRRAAGATKDQAWQRAADRVPLLYLGAVQDAISPPPRLDDLREAVGLNATLAVVDNAGHALLPEQPRATASALIAWAQSLNRQAGSEPAR